MQTSVPATSEATQPTAEIVLPLPGQYSEAHQGWYAGIQTAADGQSAWHVILPDAPEYYIQDIAWGTCGQKMTGADSDRDGLGNTKSMAVQGSLLAQSILALPGDCYLPSRNESALLYATCREHIETGYLYWTSTQYSADDAWGQGFGYGYQGNDDKSYEGRARAVRRLPLQTFSPLVG
ncbi:MAG: DUF1566 domain-containing protein [Betaproteobacteria bacterium]